MDSISLTIFAIALYLLLNRSSTQPGAPPSRRARIAWIAMLFGCLSLSLILAWRIVLPGVPRYRARTLIRVPAEILPDLDPIAPPHRMGEPVR